LDINDILGRINAVPLRDGRRIVAIVGGPASGKSTLAQALAKQIPKACVLPMDGFHRNNDDLERDGLLARKGAPETFDAEGFVQAIKSMRKSEIFDFPTFDRAHDCVVPSGGRLTATDETILVEGNYLLLDAAPWVELANEWDFTIMLEISLEVLQERLVERWMDNGHDAAGALARAKRNDLPNAQLVISDSLPAELVIAG
jgi:pantothenate kinase